MKSKQSLFLMAARMLSALVTLMSMRFFINWFGEEKYGAYLFGQNFFIFVGLLDPGIFVGAARRMTEAFHHNRDEEGWRIHRTQLTLGIGIVLAGILVFTLLGAILPLKTFPLQTSIVLMAFLGIQFAAAWLLQYIAAALAARDKFSLQGTTTFLSTFNGALAALVLGSREPHSLVLVAAGYGFGTLAGLLLGLIWIRIKDPEFRLALGIDKEIARDLTHQGLTNYPNRFAGTVSNRSDRQLIGPFHSFVVSGHYQFIARPVEIMTDLIGGAIETTQPDITRSVQIGPEDASQKLHRNALVIWAMACCLMMVPSAFGDTVLRLWVPGKFFPFAGLVMVCTALNYAGELHYRALGTIYVAKGTLYRSVGFPAVNGLATLILTVPIVRAYGLAGIGVMNAVFSLVQLYPRIRHVQPEAEGHFPVRRHLLRSLGILLVAGGFAALGYGLSQWFVSLWIVLLAPLFAAGALLSCLALRLSPAPRFLAKFGFQID